MNGQQVPSIHSSAQNPFSDVSPAFMGVKVQQKDQLRVKAYIYIFLPRVINFSRFCSSSRLDNTAGRTRSSDNVTDSRKSIMCTYKIYILFCKVLTASHNPSFKRLWIIHFCLKHTNFLNKKSQFLQHHHHSDGRRFPMFL
jgi:hypothetical protein